MAVITLNELNNSLEHQTDILERVQKSSEKMASGLTSFIKSMNAFKGDQLEAERETKVGSDAAKGGFLGALAEKLPFAGFLNGLLPIIAGIAGALVASFNEFANDLARTFASIFVLDKLRDGINALRLLFSAEGSIGKFFMQFTKTFDEATMRWKDATGKFTTAPGRFVQAVQGITRAFDNGIDILRTFLKSNILTGGFVMIAEEIGKLVKLITAPLIGGAKLITTGIMDNVMPIFRFFGSIFSGAKTAVDFIADSGIGKLLGTLGSVLKKIFLPIGLIFTAYDTVKGALAGYEEDGIAGAIGGAVKGLINSIIGAPLDLLRQAVAWIAGKFGFEDAKEQLEGFSFTDIISRTLDSIGTLFKSAVNGLLETVAVMLEKSLIGASFAEDVRSLKFDTTQPNAAAPTPPTPGKQKATIATDIAAARVSATGLKESADEMNARATTSAPIVIQDNSSRSVSSGTTNQGIVMRTTTIDTNDPFLAGVGA